MEPCEQTSCDVAIIGAGPAGLAVADTLQAAGRDCLIIEAGCLAHAVARFPVHMTFFSTADLLELGGFPLAIPDARPTRRQYLCYLARFSRDRKLKVRSHEAVESVEGGRGSFTVRSTTLTDGARHAVSARRVVVATGAYGNPNLLGCAGEEQRKVSHYYTEAASYIGSRVLVVGGGNSAVEACLELWRAGVDVTLAVREDDFSVVKYWIRPDIEGRIRAGEIPAHTRTTVAEIRPRSVVLSSRSGGGKVEISNDFVLALTGYRPDTVFLERCGIEVDEGKSLPRHDPETLQTNVPGLFVAGAVAAGSASGRIFIENSRGHGDRILAAL